MRPDSPCLPARSRRQFLRHSALVLAAPATTSLFTGCTASSVRDDSDVTATLSPETDGRFQRGVYLDEDGSRFFRAASLAVLPALAQSEPAVVEAHVKQIDAAFVAFGPVTQAEFGALLSLLTWAPTRGPVAGVWSDWESASTAEVEDFLAAWRDSSSTMLNTGYNGIVKIISTSYYGQPENASCSGYPGPPAFATSALPQFQQAVAS